MARLKISLITILIFTSFNLSSQVAVNTDGSLPDKSAMLDVSSDTSGVLIPRLTRGQRNAISVPAIIHPDFIIMMV